MVSARLLDPHTIVNVRVIVYPGAMFLDRLIGPYMLLVHVGSTV